MSEVTQPFEGSSIRVRNADGAGEEFGRLTVAGPEFRTAVGYCVTCDCKCGGVAVVRVSNLRSGRTKSCGCLNREQAEANGRANVTHGGRGTRLYRIWCSMKNRCTNPSYAYYPRYGGRGIKVCDEWLNGFAVFRDWAMANGYANNLSIDRIDNDRGYDASNCRWATMREQHANKRNNVNVLAWGENKCVQDWVRDPRCDVSETTLRRRINNGVPPEQAMKSRSGIDTDCVLPTGVEGV